MPTYPQYIRLGRFIRNKIEENGWSIKRFADHYKKPANSTLHQITAAKQKSIGSDTLANIAKGLSEISGENITVQTLLDLVDGQVETPKRQLDEPQIMSRSAILWHLQRMDEQERSRLWGDALRVAADDFRSMEIMEPIDRLPLGRQPEIEILIKLINKFADRIKVNLFGELADWLIDEYEYVEASQRREFIEGLYMIVVQKFLPYQDEKQFTLLRPLGEAMGFKSEAGKRDAALMLLDHCGLKPETEAEAQARQNLDF